MNINITITGKYTTEQKRLIGETITLFEMYLHAENPEAAACANALAKKAGEARKAIVGKPDKKAKG